MKQLPHIAIYTHTNTDRNQLISAIQSGIFLTGMVATGSLRGGLYSTIALQDFINEELRHDRFEIVAGINNTLSRSSSGEQRKALLDHITKQQPDYVIVDNVYESLDAEAQAMIVQRLGSMSESVIIIQLLDRKQHLLPFINTVVMLDKNEPVGQHDRASFLSQQNVTANPFAGLSVPPPLHAFPPEETSLVRMENVSVSFDGRTVLKDITWEINGGEFWQLKGPNGSGKSTLLAMITGDSPKAYGQEFYLFGHKKGSGENVWQIKQKIGYFASNMIRDFERQDSIEKMIISGFFDSVGLYIKPTDMQVKLAGDWLRLIGLYESRNQPFRLFPAGLQRLILIARAMVKHPPLLILDEPASGLDDAAALLFTSLVNKIAAETNTCLIYVSHLPEPGLLPEKVFELVPSMDGSRGQQAK